MQERTITIGSAGKTWSVTGWKTGWAIGPESLGLSLKFLKKTVRLSCKTLKISHTNANFLCQHTRVWYNSDSRIVFIEHK